MLLNIDALQIFTVALFTIEKILKNNPNDEKCSVNGDGMMA